MSPANVTASVFNLTAAWKALGPTQTLTSTYGAVTGRITSIAIDPADSTGNTVYLGTTGGGVWKSTNAAGPAASVSFAPITDLAPSATSGLGSLSIGAVSVQPGGTGVILAGTGDPNDALDSYYGQGILRSADSGVTWTAIDESRDQDFGSGPPHSFIGEGFAGFAWSTKSSSLVVAAVTQALDGIIMNALQSNSFEGLYYSTDAGVTWRLSTIVDGPGAIVQSPASTGGDGAYGSAATSVVWNPFRQMFYAAVQNHGYYGSPDGAIWTRVAGQPGSGLSIANCPTLTNPLSCPMTRGALAVQPTTGDMFAFTVGAFNMLAQGNPDQGIWRDICLWSGNACSTGEANMFSQPLQDAALENGLGAIAQGDYDLWLAAVPARLGTDTMLYAGTEDIFKSSLLGGVNWQNTTNVNNCPVTASIAPSQHAVAVSANAGSMMFFGNDSGLWRTSDGIQTHSLCSADLENLNHGLGSLAEISDLAQDPNERGTLLAAQGVLGTSRTVTATNPGAWPQVLGGFSSHVAIDPANPLDWYTSAQGVSIYLCASGGSCDAALFPDTPLIGDLQTDADGDALLNPAVWMLDPQKSSQHGSSMIVGTCRVWRGNIADASATWTPANALSPVLDDPEEPGCSGEAQISALGASGPIASATNVPSTQEILYAAIDGADRDGITVGSGTVAGHVFTQTVDENASGATPWTDISRYPSTVTNDSLNLLGFNPGGFTVSSVVPDTHDASGQTVYATIQGLSGNGISEPTVYRSANQGLSWTNITANLPSIPVNGLVVDPGDANIVYVATDAGVYVATAVTTCAVGAMQCWSAFGTALPYVPVTAIKAWGSGAAGRLRAGTYGRGVWEIALASASQPGGNAPTTVQLSPSALVFAGRSVGTLSAGKAITVTNTGASPLVISAIETTGDYSEQDTCGAPVAAAGHCVVTIAFDPQSVGARDGAVILLGNLAAGQATAGLTGTGTPAGQMVLTPASLVFDPVAVGAVSAAKYITVANTGTTPVTLAAPVVSAAYRISGNTCAGSVPAQTSCTLGIAFAPATQGSASGIFSIGTAVGTLSALLSGTGLSPARDGLSGPTLTRSGLQFVPQLVGTFSAPQIVIINNTGGEPLTLVDANVDSADFILKSGCVTVPAGNTCAMSVTFAPTVAGVRSGTLTIADLLHAGSTAQTILLTGTGVARGGVPSVGPLVLNFGPQGIGSRSSSQPVTFTNNGTTTLTGLLFSSTGDFETTPGSCGGSLASGASCEPEVTFTPSTEGPRSGVLAVTGSNQTYRTALNGAGIAFTLAAPAGLSPAKGDPTETVVIGASATYQVSILPTGASTATLALACSGQPSGYSCAASGGPDAGVAQMQGGVTGSVTITIQPTGAASSPAVARERSRSWGAGLLTVAFAIPFWRRHAGRRKLPRGGLAWLAAALLSSLLAGCAFTTGSSGGRPGIGGAGTGGIAGATSTILLTVSAPGIEQQARMTFILEQ